MRIQLGSHVDSLYSEAVEDTISMSRVVENENFNCKKDRRVLPAVDPALDDGDVIHVFRCRVGIYNYQKNVMIYTQRSDHLFILI